MKKLGRIVNLNILSMVVENLLTKYLKMYLIKLKMIIEKN
jgi:hypothetical protein